jgi:hypothetical protein
MYTYAMYGHYGSLHFRLPRFTGITRKSRIYITGRRGCYKHVQDNCRTYNFYFSFLGVTCIYRPRVYTAPSGYRCRIYNAVSRSTLQVSQGLAGIIRGLESTLQIAKSYKHLQDRAGRVNNRKIKIKQQEKNKDKGARSSRNEDQNQEDMQDEKEGKKEEEKKE